MPKGLGRDFLFLPPEPPLHRLCPLIQFRMFFPECIHALSDECAVRREEQKSDNDEENTLKDRQEDTDDAEHEEEDTERDADDFFQRFMGCLLLIGHCGCPGK